MKNGYEDNALRLEALRGLDIFGGGTDHIFEALTNLATKVMSYPISYISLSYDKSQRPRTVSDFMFCEGAREHAFCLATIDNRDLFHIEDTLADGRFSRFPQVMGPPYIRSYCGAPIFTRRGHSIGAFCVVDFVPRRPTSVEIISLQQFSRLTTEIIELRAQAVMDVLTGIPNRRAFFDAANEIFAQAVVANSILSCIAFDIDNFKNINDMWGHLAGDEVMKFVGHTLLTQANSSILPGRVGGEEFLLLVKETSQETAIDLAEKIRKIFESSAGKHPPFTASFGVATLNANDVSVSSLINRADQACYAAKKLGRNTVCVSESY
ncbi:sensor domain-containing diguanylate cyclase [Agrobacterium tumefaciens]|uniref:sensor domain-containing diguanylate cyclase n=1 Tax=Agrobacterium tumefaciens TaxID=358 RepID=UPI00097645B8|nr:hypothetical protein BV900_27360 [Agrobacterium tumefaciens]